MNNSVVASSERTGKGARGFVAPPPPPGYQPTFHIKCMHFWLVVCFILLRKNSCLAKLSACYGISPDVL